MKIKLLRFGFIFVLVFACLGLQSKPVSAALIHYVAMDGTGDCTSWASACGLQTALGKAVGGEQIWVKAGIYTPGTDRMDHFGLKSGVGIYGGFNGTENLLSDRVVDPTKTILSGEIGSSTLLTDNSVHVIWGDWLGSTTILDGFTISGGYGADSDSWGAGITLMNSSSPVLSNLRFVNNTAAMGGAFSISSGSPTLTNVVFSGNSALGSNPSFGGKGGAMYLLNASATLTRVEFTGNNAQLYGGGILAETGTYTLIDVKAQQNIAGLAGGAIWSGTGLDVTGGFFAMNNAPKGGAIFHGGSTLSLKKLSFIRNTADEGAGLYVNSGTANLQQIGLILNQGRNGAAIYNAGTLNLTNSVIDENTASSTTLSSHAGGIYNQSIANLTNLTLVSNVNEGVFNQASASLTVRNSILWNNTVANLINETGGTAAVTYSDVGGTTAWPGTGNINLDPLALDFTELSGMLYTRPLLYGSPAIDAGDPLNCPLIDQRDYPRPRDGNGDGTAVCDMGATEFQAYKLSITLTGQGSVTRVPNQNLFDREDLLSLDAVPAQGWQFDHCVLNGRTSTDPAIVNMPVREDLSYEAVFTQIPYRLNLTIDPPGSGVVQKFPDQETYHFGDIVTLMAAPRPGASFDHWNRAGISQTQNPLVITVSQDETITAYFGPAKTFLPLISGR